MSNGLDGSPRGLLKSLGAWEPSYRRHLLSRSESICRALNGSDELSDSRGMGPP